MLPSAVRVRAPYLLVAALLIHAIAFAISVNESALPAGDFDRYYEIGSTAGRPYRDYQVEHPIATVLVFKTLARVTGNRPAFGLGIVVLDLIADAIMLGALYWGWGMAAAAFGAIALTPVLGLFFNRVDPWSTAAAIVAVAAWRRQRPIAMGVAITIGAAFKLWPLVLATLLLAPWRGRKSIVALASFSAAAAVLGGVALAIAGTDGIRQVLTFRGATGWQIESLTGSLVHLADTGSVRMESGAWRVGTINHFASTAMFLAAAPICIWASWRGARLDRVGEGWLASVTTLLLLSALLSAQYVIWLAPAAAITWSQGDRRLGMLTVVAIILTQLLWTNYDAVLSGHLAGMLLVVARNAVLLVLAASAIARLVQTTGRQRKNQIASTA